MSAEQLTKVCYKHPREETRLSCGRCERPICTRCSVLGPAGVRCRECGSFKTTQLYKISPGRLILTVVLGLLTSLLSTAIIFYTPYIVFIFLGPVYGYALAEVVLRASGQKRTKVTEIIGVACIVVSMLVVLGVIDGNAADLVAGFRAHAPVKEFGQHILGYLSSNIWGLIAVGLAIPAFIRRMR